MAGAAAGVAVSGQNTGAVYGFASPRVQAIIDTAGSKGCDLIVMASHRRHGISAIVLGSEPVKVLAHCKIPVLVHR